MFIYPLYITIIVATLTTPVEAKAISCVLVKAAIMVTGSEAGAEHYARQRGYTDKQIAQARRNCLGKKP